MPISPDHEADLRWFFNQATGDCGLRSPSGAQLAMLRQGILPGKFERQFARDLPDGLLVAGERANRVARILGALSPIFQRTIALHYGARLQSENNSSVALACATTTAQAHYTRAKTKSPDARHLVSVHTWFLWLCTRGIDELTPEHQIQQQIESEAQNMLQTASTAYEETATALEPNRRTKPCHGANTSHSQNKSYRTSPTCQKGSTPRHPTRANS